MLLSDNHEAESIRRAGTERAAHRPILESQHGVHSVLCPVEADKGVHAPGEGDDIIEWAVRLKDDLQDGPVDPGQQVAHPEESARTCSTRASPAGGKRIGAEAECCRSNHNKH